MKARLKGEVLLLSTEFSGKRPWAAEILGLDPERLFERRFLGVKVVKSGADDGHDTASIALPVKEGVVYELGAWEVVAGQELRAYFIMRGGKPEKITKDEVCAALGQIDDGEDVDLPF